MHGGKKALSQPSSQLCVVRVTGWESKYCNVDCSKDKTCFPFILELLHIAKQVLIPMGLSTKTEQEKRRLKERQFDAIVNLCNIDQAASFDDDAGGFEYESEQ